jgi:hypothetical protein
MGQGDDMICLGYFKSPVDAALAYDQAARERYGDSATLNFPAKPMTASNHGPSPTPQPSLQQIPHQPQAASSGVAQSGASQTAISHAAEALSMHTSGGGGRETVGEGSRKRARPASPPPTTTTTITTTTGGSRYEGVRYCTCAILLLRGHVSWCCILCRSPR